METRADILALIATLVIARNSTSYHADRYLINQRIADLQDALLTLKKANA